MSAVEEPRDAAGGRGWPASAGDVDGLQPQRRSVVLHEPDIESLLSLHCNEHDTPELVTMSRAFFCGPLQCHEGAVTMPQSMAKRPVFSRDLGDYFRSLRTARGWKQSQAANIASRRGIALSYQALRGLEDGKTKNPDKKLLEAVADLYEMSYEEIAARVIEKRFGVGQSATTEPGVPFREEGGPPKVADGHHPQVSADDPRFLSALSDVYALAADACKRDGALKGILAEMAYVFGHIDRKAMVRSARARDLRQKRSLRLPQRRGRRNSG